jgi:ribosome recycling factor
MSVQDVLNETKPKMEAVIEDFKRKLSNVRTGRASIGILDSVVVDYYGTPTPLAQMASIAVPEPQLLTVQPWDISQIGAVEKAITAANLGMSPSNDGKIIRLNVPALNEERRK